MGVSARMMSLTKSLFLKIIVLMLILTCGLHAEAATKRKTKATPVDKSACLIVDADSGKILHQENAGKLRYPASLTKMMTLYLAFEALEKKKLRLNDDLPISQKAASMPKTNLNLCAGDTITLKEAIMGVVVHSANDAAVVIAEALAGSEQKFANLMTKRARDLGMKNTTFKNASGLPHNEQKSTAYDLARLAIALRRDHPRHYPLFSETSFSYNGVTHESHNRVMRNYEHADGLKTGYIRASGFNLVTSAKKDDKKLVGVVLGGSTAAQRDRKMISLLDRYINQEALEDETPKRNKTLLAKKSVVVK